MLWLSPKKVIRVVRAAIGAGVDPCVACCGLDPALVATLPTRESRADQLLSDVHELNRIDRLVDGTRPLKVWMRNALTLMGPRRERALLTAIKKNEQPKLDCARGGQIQ